MFSAQSKTRSQGRKICKKPHFFKNLPSISAGAHVQQYDCFTFNEFSRYNHELLGFFFGWKFNVRRLNSQAKYQKISADTNTNQINNKIR